MQESLWNGTIRLKYCVFYFRCKFQNVVAIYIVPNSVELYPLQLPAGSVSRL